MKLSDEEIDELVRKGFDDLIVFYLGHPATILDVLIRNSYHKSKNKKKFYKYLLEASDRQRSSLTGMPFHYDKIVQHCNTAMTPWYRKSETTNLQFLITSIIAALGLLVSIIALFVSLGRDSVEQSARNELPASTVKTIPVSDTTHKDQKVVQQSSTPTPPASGHPSVISSSSTSSHSPTSTHTPLPNRPK